LEVNTMKSTLGPVLIRTSLALACLVLGPHPNVGANGPVAHLSGRSLDAHGVYAGPVDIYIERWSTDQERENVRKPLAGKAGPDALLNVLEKVRVRVGYVLTPGIQNTGARALGRRAWNIEYAREVKTPAGRRIIIASQDHLPIGEFPKDVAQGTAHRADVLEFRFDRNDKGVGKLVDGDKIVFNESIKTIEIAKYDAQPIRLADVVPQQPRARTMAPKEYYGAKSR
jgi:hypothetical protein